MIEGQKQRHEEADHAEEAPDIEGASAAFACAGHEPYRQYQAGDTERQRDQENQPPAQVFDQVATAGIGRAPAEGSGENVYADGQPALLGRKGAVEERHA